MKNLVRVEEACMLALAIYGNSFLPFAAWVFWVLFLLPDVGMLGYLVNARIGAVTYNVLHHKGVAIACYLAGYIFKVNELALAGLVLFGHSSFDRLLGYGLKYPDAFKHTHLGWIGK
ncbi:MAG: DUF4260 domain-containing protein [Cyclobacteriaceae bacterium]|nr:DUF4260 domain-containing protein [Cytophagales bacterium]MBX2898923.1 DUF4260 domain-containing protein [Cyclobacteriaceae bacterium]